MESLYNFQWDIPTEAETSYKTISYSLHGETNKYVIENAVEFLTDKFGFFHKGLQEHSSNDMVLTSKTETLNISKNKLFGVINAKTAAYLSEFFKYNNEGCLVQKQEEKCYDLDLMKLNKIVDNNLPDILNTYIPSDNFSALHFANEFVKHNQIPFFKEAFDIARNGDDFFATDNTQCKKIIPIIAATANFADKIGYFTKTNLQQRGLLKRVNLEDIDTSKPFLINFYGGAGIGKSTTAMLITAELKKMGLNADYINETAKLHIYNGESYLLDGSIENQISLFKEQKEKIDMMYKSVHLSVTDSPLLMYGVYAKKGDSQSLHEFKEAISDMYYDYNNINILLVRDLSIPYEKEGRVHSLEESTQIDKEVENTLVDNRVPFVVRERNDIDGICDYIIKQIQKAPILAHHVHERPSEQEEKKKLTKPIKPKFIER